MYSFCRRRFGIDKEVFQLKIHLFYIKRNETGEIYDPPVLYALTDEKKTSDSKDYGKNILRGADSSDFFGRGQ